MTSEDVIKVANVVLEWYYTGSDYSHGRLTPEEEQAILNLYYAKHGVYEALAVDDQDWYEVAEKIR